MGGKGGGERREGGGEHRQVHTSTNKAQQDTNNTREGKEYYEGEIPRSSEGRSPDIIQGGVGGLHIHKSGFPCTTRLQETVGGRM